MLPEWQRWRARSRPGVNAYDYDANILKSYAEAMYRRAKFILVYWAFVGFFVGALLGFVVEVAAAAAAMPLGLGLPLTYLFGGVGLLVGLGRAQSLAFDLKLKAQTTMCQVAIEANTRRANPRTEPQEEPSAQAGPRRGPTGTLSTE